MWRWTRPIRSSRSKISRLASAIAHERGCPPNVIPCVNAVVVSEKKGSTTLGRATTAPSGA